MKGPASVSVPHTPNSIKTRRDSQIQNVYCVRSDDPSIGLQLPLHRRPTLCIWMALSLLAAPRRRVVPMGNGTVTIDSSRSLHDAPSWSDSYDSAVVGWEKTRTGQRHFYFCRYANSSSGGLKQNFSCFERSLLPPRGPKMPIDSL